MAFNPSMPSTPEPRSPFWNGRWLTARRASGARLPCSTFERSGRTSGERRTPRAGSPAISTGPMTWRRFCPEPTETPLADGLAYQPPSPLPHHPVEEVPAEDRGDDVHQPVDVFGTAPQDGDHRVSDEPRSHAV